MATVLVKQSVNLEKVIVESWKKYGGGSRTIREIREMLRREYGDSLDYSQDTLFIAIERLVHHGWLLDNMLYHLRIRIYSSFFNKYNVEFRLYGHNPPDETTSPESVSVPMPSPETTSD